MSTPRHSLRGLCACVAFVVGTSAVPAAFACAIQGIFPFCLVR